MGNPNECKECLSLLQLNGECCVRVCVAELGRTHPTKKEKIKIKISALVMAAGDAIRNVCECLSDMKNVWHVQVSARSNDARPTPESKDFPSHLT